MSMIKTLLVMVQDRNTSRHDWKWLTQAKSEVEYLYINVTVTFHAWLYSFNWVIETNTL